jgi:hypothetical protein
MNTCDSDANPIDSGCLNGIDLRPFTQNWSFDTGILYTGKLDAERAGCRYYWGRELRPKKKKEINNGDILNTFTLDANPINSGCLNGTDLRPFTQNWSFDTGILYTSKLDAGRPGNWYN